LLVETALAAGFTSIDGGGISHNLSYAKDVPLAQTLAHWQYCDRLIGEYAAAGILLNRETYGPLTGTLIPPFLSHAVSILEALLAAEQGVKCITLSYGQGGNLTQDVAAIRSLRQLAGEYLSKMGFSDVAVTVSLHQWMGGFPQEEAKAYGVISLGAVTAALGRADKVVTKTPMEAIGIPTPSAYAAGLSCTRQILSMLAEQPMPHSLAIEEESRLIGEETRSIVDCVLQLGNGDVALGAAKGVEQGILDVPFSPSRQSAGRMLPARDNEGCVRIFEPGNLPFSKDILDFHRQKIEERAKAERRAPSFQMVIDDIYAVSNSRLVGRPR
ncbi:methylaspartate mutase subunit E, partial [Merdimmobilis hominis]